MLPEGALESPLIPLLADEIVKDEPGQEAVLDRLLDLLLIAVLRAWFARPEAETPAWYRAYSDPVVGRALRILENNPTHRWTIAALAEATNVSRATLARRFSELVGEPPMAFLTSWRIALAADLLLEPGATIGSVAHQVGYGSPFALSTAFKRVRGISPAAIPGSRPRHLIRRPDRELCRRERASWPSDRLEALIPLADVPVPDDPVDDEGIVSCELLGRLAGREDRHRSFLLRIREWPRHLQRSAAVEVPKARAVRGHVGRRLGKDILGGFIEEDVLHR